MTNAALPDVLVVGAGGSGAPLAARLAERGARVLLLEAGPVPAPNAVRDASSLAAAMPGHPLAAAFESVLTAGRPHTVTRGQVAGGSTAINGGYFRRARAHDLDHWAREAGDERWSAKGTAAVWQRLESDHDFGDQRGHGAIGPMPVTRDDGEHPVSAALMAAGLAAGLPLDLDKNASPEGAPGVGPTPSNVLAGERWSTARAYLDRAPAGLEVRGGHRVVQVLIEHGRAVGVRALVEGRTETLRAGLVVLSAGAISTPHLLLLSGVGPAGVLRERGIRVKYDAPTIGTRLDDHANLELRFTVPTAVLAHSVGLPLGVSLHATSGVDDTVGDIEVLSFLHPLARMLGTDPADEHLSLVVSPLKRTGRGQLELDPADVTAPPHLCFHYAENDDERSRLRSGVRFAAGLLRSASMQNLGVRPEHPELVSLDDRALDTWVLEHLSTALHTCGTTPMGCDPATSVVDGRGAVHGVPGLHVADVGMLPRTPLGGPAATAVLIGEVIADALT